MKKVLIILTILFWGILPIEVKADMGPKPSIVIDINDEEDCYATLLSKQEVSGPYVAYDLYGKQIFGGEMDEEIFAAFSTYEDVDGYHFMQLVWNLNEGNINWNYYPPDEFKVLLYYPQSDTYKISDSYDTYAFNSSKFKTKYFSTDNFTVVNALVNLNYSTDDNIQYLIDIKNAIDKKDIIDVTVDFYHNKAARENAKILPSYYRELHSSERYTNIIESYK